MEDFYFSTSDPTERKRRRKLINEGKLRKIATRLYTSIMDDDELLKAIKSGWPQIVRGLYPNAIISHRTAFDYKPSPQGCVYITHSTSKIIEIGSLKIVLIRGPNLHKDDNRFLGTHCSSRPRAYLEMFSASKRGTNDDRFYSQEEIENKLETIISYEGEEALNAFRDQARDISKDLALEKNFENLDSVIGALMGTRKAKLKSKSAISRSEGLAYDRDRVLLFSELSSYLKGQPLFNLKDPLISNIDHFNNKAFFESYFSNYIEGTKFLIEEAERIIFEKEIITNRTGDSHDVGGTYDIASNQNFMTKRPSSFDEFISDLKYIHINIMKSREDKRPGEFKQNGNMAGATYFVRPDKVLGTLNKGYDYYQDLSHPFARAIFASFLISEVHPFDDGNGRTCRIVLNRELLNSGMPSIIIPTVFREDYLGGLKSLTKRGIPGALVRMFTRAIKFSHLEFTSYQKIKKEISTRNWFLESNEAKIIE